MRLQSRNEGRRLDRKLKRMIKVTKKIRGGSLRLRYLLPAPQQFQRILERANPEVMPIWEREDPMATDREIEKALTVLSAAYPRFDLPEETIRIYQRLLADLDFDLLKAATLQCATMCKFFPTVAEIRDAATEIVTMAEHIPTPIEAWGEVIQAIRKIGGNSFRPDFSHPMIDELVKHFGWHALCTSDHSFADRARFMDAYADMLKASRRRSQMLPEVLAIVENRLSTSSTIKEIAEKIGG